MRYLIHNVYGDCDALIASHPEDVECVPRGWTPEEEAALAERLQAAELSGISCLPCLLEWVPTISAWVETRVADLEQPWTWQDIDAAHNANVDAAIEQHSAPPPEAP